MLLHGHGAGLQQHYGQRKRQQQTAASTTARHSAARERRRFLHTCPLKAHATMGMSPSTGMQNSTRHKNIPARTCWPVFPGCALWGGASPVFWVAPAAACASAGGQMTSGAQVGFRMSLRAQSLRTLAQARASSVRARGAAIGAEYAAAQRQILPANGTGLTVPPHIPGAYACPKVDRMIWLDV